VKQRERVNHIPHPVTTNHQNARIPRIEAGWTLRCNRSAHAVRFKNGCGKLMARRSRYSGVSSICASAVFATSTLIPARQARTVPGSQVQSGWAAAAVTRMGKHASPGVQGPQLTGLVGPNKR